MTSENADRQHGSRAAVLGLLALSCVLFATCGIRAPREGWNERWGPLVPHKSFPGDCGICHVPERWDVLKDDFEFDHEQETGHALEGAHALAACLRCHNDFGPVQAYSARGCAGCHTDIHQGQLTGECTLCHNENNWRPEGLVAEHARTRFPLYGAHLAAACEACHVRAPTGDYKSVPTECSLCHTADLARATSPNHAAQGWTNTCERCHTPIAWGGGAFVHGYFPLEGGHDIDCSICHTGGGFEPLPITCISCHADDRARAPNHDSFATTCQDCHTIQSWLGARIDHSSFPLTGGHALACTACHTNGRFDDLPTTCISCHQDDYNGAPNHENYSTTCENCHGTTRWEGATFQHTSFPLQGPHNVRCTECHVGNNAPQFTCLDCHAHTRSEMDKEHDDVRNYRYDSAACYSCHRDGRD